MADYFPIKTLFRLEPAEQGDNILAAGIKNVGGTLTFEDSGGAFTLAQLAAGGGGGDFVGPAGAVADNIVVFDGVTGKLGKDGGIGIAALQAISEKGAGNGYASLDGAVLVIEPVQVIHETGGPTDLTVAAVADGEALERSGATIVGGTSVTTHVAAGDPHTQYQKESEKGAANGYASLNADTAVVEPATGVRETGGATNLTMGVVADGQLFSRSGTSVVGVAPSASAGTPRQEQVTTQVITGTDTAITDTLNFTPADNNGVVVFFNGIKANQGAGLDYTISGTTITWLASSGTALDMDTADGLSVTYRS